MLVIGLTGGIASGKSTVAAALEAVGAPVLRSDALAREVVAPGSAGLAEVARAFGPGVLGPDGALDRARLGAIVFADAAARRVLEGITHPRIRQRTLTWLRERGAAGAPAAVCDIPLLFEVGLDGPGSFVDRVWVVAVSPKTQLARLMRRDGLSLEAAQVRLRAQWPLAEKVRRADLVLRNEGSPTEVQEAAVQAWRRCLQETGGRGPDAP